MSEKRKRDIKITIETDQRRTVLELYDSKKWVHGLRTWRIRVNGRWLGGRNGGWVDSDHIASQIETFLTGQVPID